MLGSFSDFRLSCPPVVVGRNPAALESLYVTLGVTGPHVIQQIAWALSLEVGTKREQKGHTFYKLLCVIDDVL